MTNNKEVIFEIGHIFNIIILYTFTFSDAFPIHFVIHFESVVICTTIPNQARARTGLAKLFQFFSNLSHFLQSRKMRFFKPHRACNIML